MSSAIRDGIRGSSRTPRRAPTGPVRRGGFFDLVIVIAVVLAVATRTPLGGLAFYGLERIRGLDTDLPTLTAYFSSGAAPPVAEIADLAPEVSPPSVDDPNALPEPWRTAVRAALAGGVPPALATRITDAGGTPNERAALATLDALWAQHRDAETVLEVAAIGAAQRDRAISRATSAGEDSPESYAVHRRYLGTTAGLEADRFVAGTLGLATVLDLSWPILVPHRVSSPFGDRIHPVLKTKKFHNGIDLSVPIGTPVHSAQNGMVTVVGESAASGRYMVIDHGNGVRTSYCHLELAELPKGTSVDRGQRFAQSGNTGRSTGPHLHYIVRIGGKAVDPARFRPDDS